MLFKFRKNRLQLDIALTNHFFVNDYKRIEKFFILHLRGNTCCLSSVISELISMYSIS